MGYSESPSHAWIINTTQTLSSDSLASLGFPFPGISDPSSVPGSESAPARKELHHESHPAAFFHRPNLNLDLQFFGFLSESPHYGKTSYINVCDVRQFFLLDMSSVPFRFHPLGSLICSSHSDAAADAIAVPLRQKRS